MKLFVSQTMEEMKKNNDWKKSVDQTLTYIGLTILPGQYGHIWTAKDGAEAWKALADIYEKNSCATQISLKWQFYSYQHDTNNSIQSYISSISSLTACIEALSITLSPTDITNILIFNLNESYLNIATTLTATKDELSIANVTGALIDKEGRWLGSGDPKEKDAKDVVWYAWAPKSIRCFNCRKMGNMAWNCCKSVTQRRMTKRIPPMPHIQFLIKMMAYGDNIFWVSRGVPRWMFGFQGSPQWRFWYHGFPAFQVAPDDMFYIYLFFW